MFKHISGHLYAKSEDNMGELQSTWFWGRPFCTIFPTQQAGDALLNKACLTKHSTIWVWLKIGYPKI